jgi:hypothetical protein
MLTISGIKLCNKGGRATFRLHYACYAYGLRTICGFRRRNAYRSRTIYKVWRLDAHCSYTACGFRRHNAHISRTIYGVWRLDAHRSYITCGFRRHNTHISRAISDKLADNAPGI